MGDRISGVTGIPSRRPGDRSRDSVGRGWVGSNYTNTQIPTARRRARTLGSARSPESPVGDVPSTMHSMVAVAAYHMRARPCREVRLIGLDDYDVLHDVLAGGEPYSTFNRPSSVGQLTVTVPPTGPRRPLMPKSRRRALPRHAWTLALSASGF